MQQEKIEVWYQLQQELKRMKAAEAAMRAEIVKEAFGENRKEGTHKLDLGGGFVLVAKQPYTRKINPEVLQRLPVALATKCTRTSYSLNKKAYDLLVGSEKALFDECLITTPGAPSLEVKEIK